MSRAIIYEFFLDCTLDEYHFQKFDSEKGRFDLSNEPLKKVQELDIESINDAHKELIKQSAANPSKRLICIFDSQRLKIGFHSKGFIKGMSFCMSERRWWSCDADQKLFTFLTDGIKANNNEYVLKIFFGDDPIFAAHGVYLDEAGVFFMDYTDKFIQLCHDTGLVWHLTAVIQHKETVWVKTCNNSDFVLISEEFNKAISILRAQGFISQGQQQAAEESSQIPHKIMKIDNSKKDKEEVLPIDDYNYKFHLNEKLFEISADGKNCRYGFVENEKYNQEIRSAFEITLIEDLGDVILHDEDYLLVFNEVEFGIGGVENHFSTCKEYTGIELLIDIMKAEDAFKHIGKLYLQNWPIEEFIGIKIFKNQKEAEVFLNDTVQFLKNDATDLKKTK